MNRTLKRVWNLTAWLLVSMVVALAVMLAGIRLVGITPYTVLSGSMEPVYPVGSLVYVQKSQPQTIQVGDPITFILNESLTVATHRVIEIDRENQRFYTQGDANDAPDGAPVHFNNLIGKPIFCIPRLGYFSAWLSQPPGTYIAMCAAVILLVLVFLPDLLDKADAADRKKTSKSPSKEGE